MAIKAVFFDFDGVLTPHGGGSSTTVTNLLPLLDASFSKAYSCYRANGRELLRGEVTHGQIWPDFCKCVGKELDIKILQNAFYATPTNLEVFELAAKVRKSCKTGIITDNSGERWAVLEKKFGLSKLFDSVTLSFETYSLKTSEKI